MDERIASIKYLALWAYIVGPLIGRMASVSSDTDRGSIDRTHGFCLLGHISWIHRSDGWMEGWDDRIDQAEPWSLLGMIPWVHPSDGSDIDGTVGPIEITL